MTAPNHKVRVRRERPERTGPIRSWSAAMGGQPRPSRSPQEGDEAEGVRAGVRSGYRVIEEYIAMGRDMASLWQPTPGGTLRVTPPDPNEVIARVTRHASDLAAAWFEFVGGAMPGMGAPPPRPESTRPQPPRAEPADGVRADREAPFEEVASSSPMDVAFRVRCPRETELGATLRRVGRSMIAQRLRPVEGEGASIPVSCSVEDGRVVFRVEVPDDAQAGWYTSCVVEEHGNTTCGTLSLRIFED